MVQVKHCWLILLTILSALLFTGCNQELHLCEVVSTNGSTYEVLNDNIVYQFDGETITSPVKTVNPPVPLRPIDTYPSTYKLVNKELSQYTGKMSDAAGYYNRLLQEGYSTEHLSYSSKTLDAKLIDIEGNTIRIIYLGNDIVRILYKNISDLNIFPPYINEGE